MCRRGAGSLHRCGGPRLSCPQGHPRHTLAGLRPVAVTGRHICRRGLLGGLPGGHTSDVRARGGVPAPRTGNRRRTQGDVLLRGQGRSPDRPAPRADRLGGAGVRRAPTRGSLEGLVRRPQLPLRACPEGALPPVRPGRRGGPGPGGRTRGRRGDRPGVAVLRAPGPAPGDPGGQLAGQSR